MKNKLNKFSKWLRSVRKYHPQSGFTLLELLISLLIASLITSGLLYMVVDLVKLDRKEATLDKVQRDMNRAMSYITNDLQEAVYVYADPSDIANALSADSAFPDGSGNVPILAFWRIDPIDEGIPDCTTGSDTFQQSCNVLRIRQAAYTLVVYVQRENDNNQNWPGQSRIIRYELSKYSDLNTLTVRDGYRDPSSTTDEDASFEAWIPAAGVTPAGSSAVLVDYVSAPTPPAAVIRSPLDDGCAGLGTQAGAPAYSISPPTADTTTNTSFFACVRNPDPDNNATTVSRGNQDIYVFLRGNVVGTQPSVIFPPTNSDNYASSMLPILETQVLIKGIVDKNIQ